MQHEWDKVEKYDDLEPEAKAFVDWLIIPDKLREIKTQSQLAEELDVGENTLSKWKKRKPFKDIQQKRFREIKAVEDLEEILNATKKRATKGKGKEANDATEIWLNWYYNRDFTKGTNIKNVNSNEAKDDKLAERLENDEDLREKYKELWRAAEAESDKESSGE